MPLNRASKELPDNVVFLNDYSFENVLVCVFWVKVMKGLHLVMQEEFYAYRYMFLQLPSGQLPDVQSVADKKTVLVVLSDNSGEHYTDHFSGFKAVFKVHLTEELGNVFPVPLGYTKNHLRESKVPVHNRFQNVFFSGNINANRMDFWRALFAKNFPPKSNIKNRTVRRGLVYLARRLSLQTQFDSFFPNSHIRFTKGFGEGLSPGMYTQMLEESKISISPMGFWKPECFRHHESMRSGCIVISDPLPKVWYFANSPIIEIEQWSTLGAVIHSLLSDSSRLTELQSATIKWWEQKCSPNAVATYISNKIRTE